MIIKDKTDAKVELAKEKLGISGDIYIDSEHHIESLESHRRLLTSYGVIPMATTIEEAEIERASFENELKEKRAAESQKLTITDALEMLKELGVDTDDQ